MIGLVTIPQASSWYSNIIIDSEPNAIVTLKSPHNYRECKPIINLQPREY